MARDFFINGESMVSVKGAAGTSINPLIQLGLSDGPIRVSLDFRHRDIQVDAWGNEIPPEVQFMLAAATITMTLVHFDRDVLDVCVQESFGGAAAPGFLTRAGSRLGNNAARFAATNHYIGLNILSPVAAKPWRFYFTYLTGTPVEFPLGTEKSLVQLTWRAIPYTQDPWNGGLGALGSPLWDYTLDT